MAKLFGTPPSEVALLDADVVGEIGRFYFNRGIAAFGNAVNNRVEKAGTASNAAIAKTQRVREWERLMGGDMANSATGFADPDDAMTAHGRAIGRDSDDGEGEEMALIDGDGVFW